MQSFFLYLSTGLSGGSQETVVEMEDKTPSLIKGQVQSWHLCVARPFLPNSVFSYLYPMPVSWGYIMGIFKAL